MTNNFLGKVFLAFLVIFAALLLSGTATAVSCSDIWADVQDVELERDEVRYFYFPVYNDSDEDFFVLEARAYRDFGDFDIDLVDYPDEIRAEDEGELTLRIESPKLDGRSDGMAYVQIRGQFEGGKYCHFSSIGEQEFEVDVETSQSDGECRGLEIEAGNVHLKENTAKRVFFSIYNGSDSDFELYGIDLVENSSYFDVEVYDEPSFVDARETESFEVRIEANSVSGDRQGTVTIRLRGRFEGGSYCNYLDAGQERFTVFVENYSGSGSSGSCGELFLNTSTIRVEQGKTVEARAYLENDSDEDFLIDYVEARDSSSGIRVEETGYEKRADAFGSAFINLEVEAYSYSETGSHDAEVEIRGHFQNGKSCSILGSRGEIPVIVEEKVPVFEPVEQPVLDCTKISLIVPETAEIDGSGLIPITIDNRTMDRATVRLYGAGLTVQPNLISVPRYSTVSERVSVLSVLGETSLVYGINGLGCDSTQRTEIVNTAETGQDEAGEAIEALSSGFLVLGQAMAILGLVIIAGLIAYFVLKP